MLDCHIHLSGYDHDPLRFREQLAQAGMEGGILFSNPPGSLHGEARGPGDAQTRLAHLMSFAGSDPLLFPFYFIDPTEPDAADQVDAAVAAGVKGFKVICSRHYPQDERAMPIYQRIAKASRPMLFHSGILYDDNPSCDFNRPGNFEHLFYVPGLRFALAHISWPWCDELIAVYGKWSDQKQRLTSSMYIDLTPGTPGIYRKDALCKLLTVGYPQMQQRMLFGTDANSDYHVDRVRGYIRRDMDIYDELELDQPARQRIFHDNLLAFVNG